MYTHLILRVGVGEHQLRAKDTLAVGPGIGQCHLVVRELNVAVAGAADGAEVAGAVAHHRGA